MLNCWNASTLKTEGPPAMRLLPTMRLVRNHSVLWRTFRLETNVLTVDSDECASTVFST